MHFGSIRTTSATSRYPGRTRFPAGSSLTHCADWSDALVAIESSGAAKKPLCDSVEKCFIQCIAPIRHCHHFIYPTQDNHRFIRWSSLTWGPTKCTIYSGACSGNPPAEQLVSTIESSMVPIYLCEAGAPTVSVGWLVTRRVGNINFFDFPLISSRCFPLNNRSCPPNTVPVWQYNKLTCNAPTVFFPGMFQLIRVYW
jgi:hypothetical protein